jgi:transposase InsO family protein
VHIAVDDYSRLAYAEVLSDEKAPTAAGFLRRAVAFYRRYGIRVQAIISDNGSCYRATTHALACRRLKIRHLHPAQAATDKRKSRTLHPHDARGTVR